MAPTWAYACLAAGLLTLAGTPLLRRLALATDFVDDPSAAHKSHDKHTPYLGGVGLIVAVLVGLLFESHLTAQVGAIALGGALIGCMGLLDDHRSTGALVRFLLEAAVAAGALAAGLRIHATDILAIDGLITIVWIVGVTNAVNLLDNMDGAAAGVTAAAAVALFAIAVLGEQPGTAVLAAALFGACVGFLAHNRPPASIFMGDTGSLFLGFVLAIAAIDVSPSVQPPASFLVPLMLLALPVLDTVTVTMARLRRGRSVALGGKDHLSHRLVKRGLGPGQAVAVLVAVEATVGVFAALAARQVVPLSVAVAATVVVIGGLAWWSAGADVYSEEIIGLPRRLTLAVLAGAGGVFLLAAPAVIALARAQAPGIAGARAARDGLDAIRAGDDSRARVLFDDAAGDLERAHDILHGPLTSAGLALPGLRANLATTRAVVVSARTVVAEAAELSALVDAANVPLDEHSDVARELTRLAPSLAGSASALQRASGELAGYDRPYLWPSVKDALVDLRGSVARGLAEVSAAADAARILPAMLGGGEPRRYFLAVQDNTELRGAGGVIHFWGELEVRGGHLRLTQFGNIDQLNKGRASRSIAMPEFLDRYREFDPANTWQNVNVSPDFSVTGQVISELYPQSGGRAVDGVIGVDIAGLAALLDVTGPVRVDGWPEPLTAANLVDVVVRQSAARYPDADQRRAFIGRAAEATVARFVSADPGTVSRLLTGTAPAVRGGHLVFYAGRPEEEQTLAHLAMAGTRPAGGNDSLLVVNQNLTATSDDPYLERQVSYTVLLDPGDHTAALTGRVDVGLHNAAPTTAAGDNRTYLSVYTPLSLTQSSLDGQPATVGSSRELGRHSYSTIVSVPAQQTRTVSLEVAGTVGVGPEDWYRLDVLHQTSLSPEGTSVTVSVPAGWRIVEAQGLTVRGDRTATGTLASDGSGQAAVRLQRTPWARLWAFGR